MLPQGRKVRLGDQFRLGNPVEKESDLIYEVINWNEKPGETAILLLMLTIFFLPISVLVLWGFSLLFPKRFIEDGKKEVEVKTLVQKNDLV